jgi:glycosyltransferase involved in cell wall biosynthesis
MVATLESHKDHPTLLRAAKILRDRQVELEIALVGGGSRETELKAMAVELGIEEIVTFFGARRDVPELLGQSDVFVLATTPQEGRPGVILEALAAGLPIIASDVEPLREVLENGRWGKLVPVGNADALAESLVEAIRSTPDQGSVAAGRAYAARFTPESMVADYLREVGFGPAKLDEPLGPVAQNELSFK